MFEKKLFVTKKYGRLQRGKLPDNLRLELLVGKKPELPKLSKNYLPTQQSNNIGQYPLPYGLWTHHIFRELGPRDLQALSVSCKFFNALVSEYARDRFKASRAEVYTLIEKARNNLVQLNEPLLNRLCNSWEAHLFFNAFTYENDPTWAIAAVCGDEKWLKFTYGNFTNITVKNHPSQMNVLRCFAAVILLRNITKVYFKIFKKMI